MRASFATLNMVIGFSGCIFLASAATSTAAEPDAPRRASDRAALPDVILRLPSFDRILDRFEHAVPGVLRSHGDGALRNAFTATDRRSNRAKRMLRPAPVAQGVAPFCQVEDSLGTPVVAIAASVQQPEPAHWFRYNDAGLGSDEVNFFAFPLFEGSPMTVITHGFNALSAGGPLPDEIATPFGIPSWEGNLTTGWWALVVLSNQGGLTAYFFLVVDPCVADGSYENGVCNPECPVCDPDCECCADADCDDGIDCTVDTCNEAAGGTCDNAPDDALCNDQDACTDDTCDAKFDCVNTSIDADPVWTLRTNDGLSPRSNYAMAYDSCRGVVVLYGGQDNSTSPPTYFEDTREWDGNTWALRAMTGPGPHRGHEMAFDESRCVVVLFGGNDPAANYLNDTWEWNGNTWTQRCASCLPPTRHQAGMVYDSALGAILLFGGWGPGYLNDLWKWDGTTWEAVPTTSAKPSPRSGFAMEYDSVRDRTFVFGGAVIAAPCVANNTADDMWELDMSTSPATWTLVCDLDGTCGDTPSPRTEPTMVYDSSRSMMVLFGGGDNCSTRFGDTWEWNGSAWTQVFSAGPSPRRSLDMAYDATRNEVALFGGWAGEASSPVFGDTWVYGGGCP